MSTISIGSSNSFWQQDQAFQQQSQQQTNSSIAAAQSINSAMSAAEANLGKGLASIANATALKRVDTQLAQEIQNVLTGNTGQPLSSSTSSSAASSKVPVAATGTGTAALTTTTPLSTLGIPAGGVITVSAGQNMTTYDRSSDRAYSEAADSACTCARSPRAGSSKIRCRRSAP